jgi:uncharacterized protein YacL (UPF0231 family)
MFIYDSKNVKLCGKRDFLSGLREVPKAAKSTSNWEIN